MQRYETIRKSVSSVQAAGGVAFPSSSGVKFDKKDKPLVAHQLETYRMFTVIVQLCVAAQELFPDASDALTDIAHVALAGMQVQLQSRDELWIKRALPEAALPAFHALGGSTITPAVRERFLAAMQLAALQQQAKPAHRATGNSKWPPRRPPAVKGKSSPSGNKPSSYSSYDRNGRGAGPSADRN
jgi:hypothetical protein